LRHSRLQGADVRRRSEVARLVQRTRQALGPIDLLVVNAGVFRRTPLEKTAEKDWRFHIETNLEGAFWCAQRVGLEMARRGGAIVLIADVAGLRPWPAYLPYSISKAGVVALTQGLAIRLAPRVRVNAVAPGPVLPPEDDSAAEAARAAAQTLLKRLGTAEDVAEAVVYLATAPYVTGVVLPVDGGRHLA
jgi:pteridine reductase